uniref:Uncharacterized protein n=1 Tax=Brassica oleracea TaxID=3712 RepID=A0A3P6EBM0_BRAOL|nr:unnamed protein product [Brassica oleracea]
MVCLLLTYLVRSHPMVSLGSKVKMMLMLFVLLLMILELLIFYLLMNGLWESRTELRSLIFLQRFLIRLVVIPMFLNW